MAALGKTNTTWAKPKISTSRSPGPMGLFQPNRKKPNIKFSLQTTVKPTTTPRPPQPPQEAATTTSIRHEGTLTIPKWNPLQRAVAAALDAVETALNRHERGHPLPKSADPQVQLAGNFAPVPEQQLRRNLKVKGKVPNCISGVYVRNGANPLFPPAAGHHLFDGDGMIHAVKFSGNGVSYACRFTKTSRIVQERAVGRPVFPKPIGELHGHTGISRLLVFYTRHLFRLIDAGAGTGVANAGVIYHHGHLLAMSEDDLPYHVRVTPAGDLATAGRYDFSGELKSPMIAHPKIDPFSGELFSLSYDVVSKPYLKYFYFSKTGEKSPDIEIPIDKPTMTHDFAITENFVIIPDSQIVFNLHEMIYGGSPVVYDKNKISRFGVLPKYAKNSNEIKWVSVPDCFCFHLWNAWEERDGDEIVIIGSCMSPADAIFNDSNEKLTSILTEIKLNLKTGESTRQPILSDPDQVNLEAGMVTRKKLGHKTRFVYLSIAEPWPKVSGFAKVDLETGEVKKYVYGDEKYGGEPFFVAQDPDSDSGREDDGYVIVFVHDEREWKSELRIVNAMDMELECTVELPSRVPYGFHGTFITEEELQMQV